MVHEPLSTATNAAYAAAGAWVLARAYAPVHVVLGVALVLLGLASAVYHGTAKSRTNVPTPGQRWDEILMYAVLWALACNIGYAAVPSLPWTTAAIFGAFALGAYHDVLDSAIVVPALGALCAVAFMLVADPWWAGLAFIAWFALAGFIRAIGERQKRLGNHRGHEAAHSTWHLMTGPAFPALWSLLFIATIP